VVGVQVSGNGYNGGGSFEFETAGGRITRMQIRGWSQLGIAAHRSRRGAPRLHILVRRETAKEVEALQERWQRGPMGAPPRPRRKLRGTSPIFTVRPSDDGAIAGDPDAPERILDQAVVARLRVHRRGRARDRHLRRGASRALTPVASCGP
jgi:hypothetical protein